MLEHSAQRSMALGLIAAVRRQEIEVAPELLRNLGAWQHAHPRRGQLDSQGHSVDKPADLHHIWVIGLVERKIVPNLAGALQEQYDRAYRLDTSRRLAL